MTESIYLDVISVHEIEEYSDIPAAIAERRDWGDGRFPLEPLPPRIEWIVNGETQEFKVHKIIAYQILLQGLLEADQISLAAMRNMLNNTKAQGCILVRATNESTIQELMAEVGLQPENNEEAHQMATSLAAHLDSWGVPKRRIVV